MTNTNIVQQCVDDMTATGKAAALSVSDLVFFVGTAFAVIVLLYSVFSTFRNIFRKEAEIEYWSR